MNRSATRFRPFLYSRQGTRSDSDAARLNPNQLFRRNQYPEISNWSSAQVGSILARSPFLGNLPFYDDSSHRTGGEPYVLFRRRELRTSHTQNRLPGDLEPLSGGGWQESSVLFPRQIYEEQNCLSSHSRFPSFPYLLSHIQYANSPEPAEVRNRCDQERHDFDAGWGEAGM